MHAQGLAALLALVSLALTACGDAPRASAGDGFVDERAWHERRLAYLRFATERFDPASPTSVVAHLERARLDEGYALPPSSVPLDAWDARFAKMAALEDTRDFDALQLLNVLLGYHDDPALAPGLIEKVEAALLAFKYWYTEPTPAGLRDDTYYWTENHQVLFHTLEHLVGQTYPDAVFGSDGRTGRAHRDLGRARLLRWMDLRARFGFSEWHSNVYYQEDLNALLTLVEHADDEEVATRAAMLVDVLLLDMALHTHRDAFGTTHGRSYKKDKMSSLDDDTWNGVKLLFDRSAHPFQSHAAEDAVLLSRARRYRMPEVIRRIARTTEPYVDRERMGIALPELGEYEADPAAPYGLSFTDPADLPVWWGIGALTAWQVVPLTVATFEQYDLWETASFLPFAGLRALTADVELAQRFALAVARFLNFGLLNEVDTYTYRTADYMLSSAVDYRKGSFAAQVHTWQATFDANAVVFTNHPFRPLPETLDWSDRDLEQGGYWTGEATVPRAAQVENVGLYLYAPQWAQRQAAPLDYFRWEPYTHAYFPQDHFDEVVQEGGWTIGRHGAGYVALYSFRPARFVAYDPTRFATNGMTQPFDLVAEGGADNVWVVECARAVDWPSFAAFVRAITAAAIEVVPRGAAPDGTSAGFDVTYVSPSRGRIELGWDGPLLVDGAEVALGGHPRFDNPFVRAERQATTLDVAHDGYALRLDFAAPSRGASGPRR